MNQETISSAPSADSTEAMWSCLVLTPKNTQLLKSSLLSHFRGSGLKNPPALSDVPPCSICLRVPPSDIIRKSCLRLPPPAYLIYLLTPPPSTPLSPQGSSSPNSKTPLFPVPFLYGILIVTLPLSISLKKHHLASFQDFLDFSKASFLKLA